MTIQEIFNKVVRGLASQDWVQSRKAGTDMCLYRGPKGRKCAAGWLIDNEKYNSRIEGYVVCESIVQACLPKLEDYELLFVEECQELHDNGNGELMKEQFQELANQFNLTWPEDVAQ